MKSYASDKIRNVALVGHGGSGKTTFIEAIVNQVGLTGRMGRVEDGNTVSDYDKMEAEKGYSINTTVVPIDWKGTKINFIDTPGFFDFVGEVNAAMRAAEVAAILVDAAQGVQVGTEQAWKACEKNNKPRVFILNNKAGADVDAAIESLRDKFGSAVTPMSWPLTDVDDDLMEAIASSDEELMEKYFEGEEFTEAEIKKGLAGGIAEGSIVPVCKDAFVMGEGADAILDFIVGIAPTPLEASAWPAKDAKDEDVEIAVGDGAAAAFVFKTIVDPFVGKISVLKVVRGKLTNGIELLNTRAGKSEKLGKLLFLRGNKQEEVDGAEAGDIVAVAKLSETLSGDTLCDKSAEVTFEPVDLPSPLLYQAIEAADKKQEDKVFSGLARLREEDPSFVIERNVETRQTLLGGQGEQQLNIIKDKLKDRFNVEVQQIPQKIAYRETIRGNSDVQGKHKKQSGGAGQYGDVHIKFSPCEAEFEFEETLFGGFPISPISQAFRTKQMEDFFDNAGFITLYDETVMIEDEIQLVGRVDGEKAGDGTADRMSAAELLKDIDPEKPVLVLEHEPVDYANLKENGADLALSGHTHAGQIFPGNLVVPFFNENAYGYKVADGLQTIVTAGVGFYGPPMRVGTDSEVTVVNITFKGGE